jgi:hypothetical protein
MKIKATLLRWSELSWDAIKQFNILMRGQVATPSLRVAIATNEQGDPLVIAPVETVLLVRDFVTSANATDEEKQRAGDAVDMEVAALGQRLGIGEVWIVVPEGASAPEDETIRVHIRKITHNDAVGVVIQNPSRSTAAYLN